MKTFKQFMSESVDFEAAHKNHKYWNDVPHGFLSPLQKKLLSKPYDREHHVKMLEKTLNSLNKHLNRNDSNRFSKRTGEMNPRTSELISKYDIYRENMIHHDRKGWEAYNEKHGWDASHTGIDSLA